jgi:hypothetical protein
MQEEEMMKMPRDWLTFGLAGCLFGVVMWALPLSALYWMLLVWGAISGTILIWWLCYVAVWWVIRG